MKQSLFPFLFICAISQAACSGSVQGVDDWTPYDISRFFKEHGDVDVPEEKIVSSGLTSKCLFDGMLDKVVFQELGVSESVDQNNILEALQALDDKITHSPGDFFEWRTANVRLCDFWIAPMLLFAPRSLGIWARYFTDNHGPDSGEHESAFEKADDVWDSTSDTEFWFTLIFAPYYPHYRIASKFHSADNNFFTDYCDTVFYLWAAANTLLYPISLLLRFFATGTPHGSTLQNRLVKLLLQEQIRFQVDAIVCVLALGNYYFGWYVYVIADIANVGSFIGICFVMIEHVHPFHDATNGINYDAIFGRVQLMAGKGTIYGALVGLTIWVFCEITGVQQKTHMLDFDFYMLIYFQLPCHLIMSVLYTLSIMAGSPHPQQHPQHPHQQHQHQHPQHQHPHPMQNLCKEHRELISKVWDKMDRNHDGILSRAEMVKAFRKQDPDMISLFKLVGIEVALFARIRQGDGSQDAFVKLLNEMDEDDSKDIDAHEFYDYFYRKLRKKDA